MNTEIELRLPPIYKRLGKECYLDPIRKKLIYITPEETVRQEVISYLLEVLKVPEEMLVVEQHLSHYGINTKKRADIVIHSLNLSAYASSSEAIYCCSFSFCKVRVFKIVIFPS